MKSQMINLKGRVRLLPFILLLGCTVTRFTTLESFDKPEPQVRYWDSLTTASYEGNYDYIFDGYNSFTLTADSLIASQLKTRETFTVRPPFKVKLKARMQYANLALYCPLWLMIAEDNGGKKVREIDVIELAGRRVVVTAHIGESGYGTHKSYSKYLNIDPTVWHNYKVEVEKNRVLWFVDKERVHEVEGDFDVEYFLWSSIIMSLRYQSDFPKKARMDFKNLRVIEHGKTL